MITQYSQYNNTTLPPRRQPFSPRLPELAGAAGGGDGGAYEQCGADPLLRADADRGLEGDGWSPCPHPAWQLARSGRPHPKGPHTRLPPTPPTCAARPLVRNSAGPEGWDLRENGGREEYTSFGPPLPSIPIPLTLRTHRQWEDSQRQCTP